MKRIFRLVFLLVLIMSFCSVGFADSDSGSFAPLSPEFLKWQQKKSSSFKTVYSTAESEYPNGYVPIPIDLSHLANNPPIETASTIVNVKADTLPSTYDLRNVNGKSYVSSVKNQGSYGTCWAFAALGSMESNYMMQGNSELDLSEMQAAYFTFKNADKSKTFRNYNNSSFIAIMDLGGNSFYPTAMFARLDGPTSESALSYSQPSKSTPDSYPRILRLRNAYYLSIADEPNVNSSTTQRDIVKRRIMQNGSVAANYYNDNTAFNKTSSGVTTYHTTVRNVNHAIQIIGWDDNFSASNFKTKPSSNGAWLIKNSWGNRWYTSNGYMGDSGCFWMSYETYLTEGTSFVAEAVDSNMKVYEYDHLGTCSLWGYYSGNTVYAANVFKSERDEKLTEIGVYTGDNNLSYEINVYKGMSSMPTSSPISGSSAAKKSGTIAYAGYHTIELDSPVTLTNGEYFSIVVKFTGYGYVPVETVVSGFSDNATIETGSFFSRNGSTWMTGTSQQMNACIKAFTTIEATSPKISDGYLPDGQVGTSYSAQLSATGTQPITWSVSRNSLPSGLSLNSTTGVVSGIPTTKSDTTFTITATNAYGSDSKNYTMNIWEAQTITTSSFEGYAGYAFSGQLKLSRSSTATWQANTSMPSGLKLNALTGEITGKPKKAGNYTVSFSATTSTGTVTKNIAFTINAKPTKPAIKTSSLAKGYIDTEYSQSIAVTGTEPITLTAEGLPNGLTMNSSGYISGTPSTVGTYSVKITAENIATELLSKTITKTVKLEILGQAPVIEFSGTSLPDAKIGEAYSYTFNLSGGTEPFTWKAAGLPTGLKFSEGTISGTPTRDGKFTVTITVSNSSGNDTLRVPLTVYRAPTIKSVSLKTATTDKSYSTKITATGTMPISWNIEGLPDTLRYTSNSTGTSLTISGTPTEVGTYSLKITASNSAGSVSASSNLSVVGVAAKLKGTLSKGTFGSSYTGSNISATGTKPITFGYSISESNQAKFGISDLSDLGLKFSYDSNSGTASITGVPTKSIKSLPITFTAENASSNGQPSTKTLKLTISGTKPVFTEPSSSAVNVKCEQGSSVAIDFSVTGTPDITFTMSNVSGFTLTKTGDNTARLSGTAPTNGGKVNITVTAKNANGKASKKVTIQTYTAQTSAPDEEPEIETAEPELEVSEPEIESEFESESESAITFGTERDSESLSAEHVAVLNDSGYVVVKVLPEMKVSVSGMYDIDVELDDDAETGAALLWFAFPKDREATSDDEIAEFYDESGAEIESVPESHRITVGAWLTEGVTYEPVIAVKK